MLEENNDTFQTDEGNKEDGFDIVAVCMYIEKDQTSREKVFFPGKGGFQTAVHIRVRNFTREYARKQCGRIADAFYDELVERGMIEKNDNEEAEKITAVK